ncbi:MAG TPA: leucine-rich repeat domain-containing protein [Ignavibacteriaceae bacterium]
MKTFHFIILLLICGCQNTTSSRSISKNSSNALTFNNELVITNNDSLILQTSRHKDVYTQFSDSSNSFCQLFGDTLKFYLSTGRFEGSYSLNIQIVNDTFNTSFNLFDNHSKYVYTPSSVQITLNKNKFQAYDYIIAQIAYNAVGKLQRIEKSRGDTVFFQGKIRLKIRDSKFTFEDFSIENERNGFYAMLRQRPDTIKKLNLYGCAFTDIPKELTSFTNLEELDLTGNNMSKSDFSLLKNLKTLKSLNLTECKLSRFPLAVLYLPNLETLNIWNNKISNIPDELYDMTSLKDLIIGNNNLTYLSPKISRLINLESFESSSTNIRVYPNEMTRLKKLTEIYPSDTMQYIPKALIKYAWGYDTILTK